MFELKIPVFENNIEYLSIIEIKEKNFLDITIKIVVGGKNAKVNYNIGKIKLITKSGSPFY